MPVVLVMNVMRLCVRTCCVIRYSWLEVALLCKVIQHPLRGSVYASNVKCAYVCPYFFSKLFWWWIYLRAELAWRATWFWQWVVVLQCAGANKSAWRERRCSTTGYGYRVGQGVRLVALFKVQQQKSQWKIFWKVTEESLSPSIALNSFTITRII